MHCDGKCYLKNQLKQQENQDQKLPAGLKEISETPLFVGSTETIVLLQIRQSSEVTYIPYSFSTTGELTHSIFHPPQTFS